MITRADLQKALPDTASSITAKGLSSSVEIYRDGYGISHVRAQTTEDAFFGQGYATAQDRLWHMDYDRHRAYGRWAELTGPAGLEQDLFMRRIRLEASARADYQILNGEARSMLEAYAAGVNTFIVTSKSLPIEYQLVEQEPEQWRPWDCLAVLKVRHILMGTFEGKVWRARLLNHLGAEKTARLHPGYQPGHLLILPPGSEFDGPITYALEELEQGAAAVNRLGEVDLGSNNWTLSGERTASGKPLLAGDPHRALDTPNVYYQNHLACPEFDVVGASFPGAPGFPHFGHNAWICWGVTHTGADYQDLYVERFKEDDPRYYEFKGQWQRAEVHPEVLKVRGADDAKLDVTVTHHGPIIAGDPARGFAIAFKYTQTAAPNNGAECLLQMLRAKSAAELDESMGRWVDPVNNFIFADVQGNIGYLTRGQVPIRSRANAWVPVPGWTGEHEWDGFIPFQEMPRSHNPEAGYIVTANQKVVGNEYPHFIALDYAPEFRARRVTIRLNTLDKATAEDMARVHAERVSIPAQHYIRFLSGVKPRDERSKKALEALLAWDGDMDRDSVAATIYSAFRLRLDLTVLKHLLGPLLEEALKETGRGGTTHVGRLRAHFPSLIEKGDSSLLPQGADWTSLMAQALADAVAELQSQLGDDISTWTWGSVHSTAPQHPLVLAFPEAADLLNPPSIGMGGDGDTPQHANYSPRQPYAISALSVLRYVFDPADWNKSGWIVPLGASGHPGSVHYADQAPIWAEVKLVPMLYDWRRIAAEAESHQALSPQ